MHTGFWLELGDSIGSISKINSHRTTQQAAAAGYPAACHLGNQGADLLVTTQLVRFKERIDAFAKQYAAMASKDKDFIY